MDCGYFRHLGRYNAWATRRLYQACDSLAPAACFVTGRVQGVPHGMAALDQELCRNLATPRAARAAEDQRIQSYADGPRPALPGADLNDRNMAGEQRQTPRRWALAHFFDHRAHHRGRAHGPFSVTAVPPPALDPLYFLPEDQSV